MWTSVGLDVNEVCSDEEQDIPNMCEKSKRYQMKQMLEMSVGNVECFSSSEVEALGYFISRIWDEMIGMQSPRELVQQSCNST